MLVASAICAAERAVCRRLSAMWVGWAICASSRAVRRRLSAIWVASAIFAAERAVCRRLSAIWVGWAICALVFSIAQDTAASLCYLRKATYLWGASGTLLCSVGLVTTCGMSQVGSLYLLLCVSLSCCSWSLVGICSLCAVCFSLDSVPFGCCSHFQSTANYHQGTRVSCTDN